MKTVSKNYILLLPDLLQVKPTKWYWKEKEKSAFITEQATECMSSESYNNQESNIK